MRPRPAKGVGARSLKIESIFIHARVIANGGAVSFQRFWMDPLTMANIAYGSLADKPSPAKIDLCPLWSESGQTRVRLDCPLSAKSEHCICGSKTKETAN
jgi:hypothetical protein